MGGAGSVYPGAAHARRGSRVGACAMPERRRCWAGLLRALTYFARHRCAPQAKQGPAGLAAGWVTAEKAVSRGEKQCQALKQQKYKL